jgi:hydrogenase maturation protein HypF
VTPLAGPLVRMRARVEGTVQGVGFRPYVYRLARELDLAGWVLNDARGVLLEVEGGAHAVNEFLARLGPKAPPLAVVERVTVSKATPSGARAFEIVSSDRGEGADAPVTPDSAVCDDCLRELFDPADRRHRYPFINCTNCGPRFTIVRGIPYDRPFTTMAGFEMCPACRAEYEDPGDRRFHAQPNACPECGPSVRLVDSALDCPGGDPLGVAAEALRAGRILAVKGIGGYHLACRADDEVVVARLRARKHREDKPFALMAADLDAAARLVELSDAARRLLQSPARPIVLAPRASDADRCIAPSVAPRAPELGVMLPYSPLHHLLLADTGTTLVMTSGNVSDEPICFRDDDALERLGSIADVLLVHDRPIQTRTDDSVVRVGCRAMVLRRSRGYVPGALPLPGEGTSRPLLACGAELKNTFCLAKRTRAWVGHHIGDLENVETLTSFTDGIAHFERLFAVRPELVAHDLHPEYLSTKYALERESIELVGVQHHHAHLAACLAEHGIADRAAVGAIFDGAGYGLDGAVWGGELLHGDVRGFRRVGALRPVRLPGGEQAIRQPWRMACAWLTSVLGEEPPIPRTLSGLVSAEMWFRVARLAVTGLASPVTTSVGRLFDAVAALCGVRAEINYEGQAAIELEAACGRVDGAGGGSRSRYEIPLVAAADGFLTLDGRPMIDAVAGDVARGDPAGVIARRFHAALAGAAVEACARAASEYGTELVVLSGGVFANRRLLEAVAAGLEDAGLRVLRPEKLPPGDGGISYGQAAVAAAAVGSHE